MSVYFTNTFSLLARENFTIKMSDSLEPVLTANTIEKLKLHNLLRESTSNTDRWIIQPLPFENSFPFIKFHTNIIPVAYDLPTFLIYLGFRPVIARRMFTKYNETNTLTSTRMKMMEYVKSYVNLIWLSSKYKGSAINTLGGYSLMGEMGFTEDFVFADICVFFDNVHEDPDILENYFNKNINKNLGNMELVDWIQEFLNIRMLKLKFLNNAVDDYL